MSGFFGVFSPSGKMDNYAFDQMQMSIHNEGYDQLETHLDDCIAMGHLMLRVTSDSKHDKQPLRSACGRYLLAGHFRLDYRDELGDKLGLSQQELELKPDSFLVMLAYQKWLDKCVHHLEGDWAFVLYDYQNASLFTARDKFGYSSLFYCVVNDMFYFSSDVDVLISALNVVKIDKVQLYLFSLGRMYMGDGCTIFEKVKFLQPATSIIVNSRIQLFISRIEYSKSIVKQYFKVEYDYLLEYKSAFNIGLHQKLKRLYDIGIFLSGGYDSVVISKSVDCQLHLSLKKQYAFTRMPIQLGEKTSEFKPDKNEFEVIEKIRGAYASTIFFGSPFSDFTFSRLLNDSKRYSYFDPIMTGNSYWIDGIFHELKKRKLNAAFVGQFGNYTLSWDAPILRFKNSIWFVLGNCIKILLNRFDTRKTIFNKRKMFSITDQWRITFLLLKKQVVLLNSFGLRKELLAKNIYDLGSRNYLKSAKYGLMLIDPSADERFLLKSFSIPEEMFNKNGDRKYIYKQSFGQFLGTDFFRFSTTNVNQAGNISFKIVSDCSFINFTRDLRNKLAADANINLKRLNSSLWFDEKLMEHKIKSNYEGVLFLKELSIMHLYINCLNLVDERSRNKSPQKRMD